MQSWMLGGVPVGSLIVSATYPGPPNGGYAAVINYVWNQVQDDNLFPALVLEKGPTLIKILTVKGDVVEMGTNSLVKILE
jgi:hypothetical protein